VLGGLILLLLSLAACDGQLPGLGGSVVAPTVASTAAAVDSPTGETSPGATPAAPPHAAATPTLVQATPTPSPTPWPTTTPGPSPTPEPAAVLIATREPRFRSILPSPDELLRAEVLGYDCIPISDAALGSEPVSMTLEILRIVEPGSAVEYQIDSQLLNCGGLGAFGLEPLVWGPDSRTLWYTTARENGPDGACRPWVRPMTRVDLTDWSALTLEQAAVSPDGSKIAGWSNGELLVFALGGDEIGRTVPAALPPQVGPPVWSPDGLALVYLQFSSFCGETAGESAVVLVDAATLESRVLLAQSAPEFESVSWPEAGRLELAGLLDSGQWSYDLATGTLTPIP
jgi:hypothetical protein